MNEFVKYGNIEIALPNEMNGCYSIFQDLTNTFGVEYQSEAVDILKGRLKAFSNLKPKPNIDYEADNTQIDSRSANMIYLKQNMKANFIVRVAQPSDAVELQKLYQSTVLVINRRDYSQAEVEDWASCGDNLSKWEGMIETHYFIVAVDQLSQIVGFSSITPQGYLHSMFVHKDFQGRGIATLLLKEIERYALATGIVRITSEVSLTARPFFEKWGYTVEVEQKRRANQLCLTNFWMAKGLV